MCKTQNADLGPATHGTNILKVYKRAKVLTHALNLDFSLLYPLYTLVSTIDGLAIKSEKKKMLNSKYVLIGVNFNDVLCRYNIYV